MRRRASTMARALSAALAVAIVVAGLAGVAVFTAGCQTVAAFAAGFLLDLPCLGQFLLRVFASGIPTSIRLARSQDGHEQQGRKDAKKMFHATGYFDS